MGLRDGVGILWEGGKLIKENGFVDMYIFLSLFISMCLLYAFID
jgi:hypothetical protein